MPYESDSGCPATDVIETKMLLNSTISDANKGAWFATIDLKDMFSYTRMKDPEYMKIDIKLIPQKFINL